MILSYAKNLANGILQHVNVRVTTLTAERAEAARLADVDRAGNFERAVFPVPPAYKGSRVDAVLEELSRHGARFETFADATRNDVGYTFHNHYFSSPDTEVLYAVVRHHRPRRVVEVGSGNSTKIIRQAIIDGDLTTKLISIDPRARTEIAGLADEIHPQRVESLHDSGEFPRMESGDVLFIDSSHKIQTGNDVVTLFLRVLPALPAGVIIHVHDVFLPYDYPRDWVITEKWGWTEQYLIHALLMYSEAFEVLWAGHYLQRARADFAGHFPNLNGGVAKSLWLRKLV